MPHQEMCADTGWSKKNLTQETCSKLINKQDKCLKIWQSIFRSCHFVVLKFQENIFVKTVILTVSVERLFLGYYAERHQKYALLKAQHWPHFSLDLNQTLAIQKHENDLKIIKVLRRYHLTYF